MMGKHAIVEVHLNSGQIKRAMIKVRGIVQGVGFRPFVYNLAQRYKLKGWVLNSSEGVTIEVEGKEVSLRKLIIGIKASPPPLAAIEQIEVQDDLAPKGYINFEIRESLAQPGKFVPVSPDISICEDCLHELFDPRDRRYLYPFINCTNCGPRFTITGDIPYDRDNTTMASFQMCAQCQSEYDNPEDRRFHAQPNACPNCGPTLELRDHHGKISGVDPISKTIELLKAGKIVAIRGLGGFHLACDAQNDQAILELRKRKFRTYKPFAIMSYDPEAIESYCCVSPKEREFFLSPRRPILLLRKRPNLPISFWVAPNNNYLGVMLPYTPLHYLLFKYQNTELNTPNFLALVMTSGNISEEPISMANQEALGKLKGLADFFLLHDREIHIRCDDSVATIVKDSEVLVRRSRGFAPHPIYLDISSPGILACGAELKNTFCLAKDNSYFLSQHIGDLQNLEAYNFFQGTISHYQKFFRINPVIVAYDLHPDYLSTRYALDNSKFRLIGVQHHHAHMASCMAENSLNEKVIGVIFDGTGYGIDGKIWGGEFLVGDYSGFERVGHLVYIPMPGGDAATQNPYRMVLGFLFSIFGRQCMDFDLDFTGRLDRQEADIIIRQIEKKVNSPLTSSCGRLFDAVSSLIGLRERITYEGQAAIELEMIAQEGVNESYGWGLGDEGGQLIVDTRQVIQEIIEDLKEEVSRSLISAKFHNTVSNFTLDICKGIRKKEGLDKVVLSGGVFQNRFLLVRTLDILSAEGFEPFFHRRVPTNDGGISLGQAVIAASKWGF
jgi:hydrogenase maturation protein HypF